MKGFVGKRRAALIVAGNPSLGDHCPIRRRKRLCIASLPVRRERLAIKIGGPGRLSVARATVRGLGEQPSAVIGRRCVFPCAKVAFDGFAIGVKRDGLVAGRLVMDDAFFAIAGGPCVITQNVGAGISARFQQQFRFVVQIGEPEEFSATIASLPLPLRSCSK